MAALGLIALGLFGLACGLAAALVATPLHLALRLDTEHDPWGRLSLRPFWGRGPTIRLPLRARAWKPRSGRGRGRHRAWPKPATLRGLIDRVHIDGLDLDLRFGTGDPAETGLLYGYLTALAHLLPGGARAVRLHPDFAAAGLAGRAEARLHVTPLALIAPGLRLARDIAGRRA